MEGKCSLIFMHDKGKTFRWRMGPTLLRVLITVAVLLPLVAGGSLWLNWKLFQDRRTVLAENEQLRRTMEANAQLVARLSGLERYLDRTVPDGLGALSGATGSETGDDAGGRSEPGDTPALSAVPPETGGDSPAAADAEDPGSVAGEAAPAPASSPAASETPVAGEPPAAGESVPPANAGVTVSVPSDDMLDKGLARVEHLLARRVGTRSLRISFDLYNTEQVAQLTGHAAFQLVLRDGRVFPLDTNGDTRYRINRLKKIVGNPTLPPEVTDTDGASIIVSVFANDDLIYRVTTPLQQ